MTNHTMKLVECDLRPVLARLERKVSKRALRESENEGVPPYSDQVMQQSTESHEDVCFSANGKCIKGWIKSVGNGKFKFLLHMENEGSNASSMPPTGPQGPEVAPEPAPAPAPVTTTPEPVPEEVDCTSNPDALLQAMLSTIYSMIA